MNTMDAALAYVDAHFDGMIAELAALCRCRSVAGDETGLEDTRKLLMEKMRALGLAPQRRELAHGNALLTAHLRGDAPETVLFFNHYDVVEEGDHALWTAEPFAPSLRGGKLYGRGVSDNKGGLMCRLHALEAILSVNGGRLPVGVRILFEGDEEISSPSLTRFAAEQSDVFRTLVDADLGLLENGRNAGGTMQAMFGLRGTCAFDLRVTTANADVHSRMGTIVPDAAWRLVWALAALKSPDERVQAPGYYDGIAPLSDSDRAALREAPLAEQELRTELGLSAFLGGAAGEELRRRYYFEPAFTLCALESGELYNGARGIVPHTARAHLAVYLTEGQDPLRLQRSLREHLDARGFSDVELVPEEPVYRAVRTPLDAPARRRLERAARSCAQALTIVPTSTGAGPAEILRRGCPALPLIGVGPANTAANHHAPDENLSLADYRSAVRFIIALLYSYQN